MDTSALPPGVWHYRLRSARQKKRAQKEDSDKQLLRLDAQLQVLSDAKCALPMVPLQEPYQKGWKRTFVLRADVKESKYAAFYEALLAQINTVKYWPAKTFTKVRRRNRKKVHVPIPQTVKEFVDWEWESPKNKLTDKERECFHTEKRWSEHGKCYVTYYVFTDQWRYVLKVQPNMITHRKVLDTVLEQQIGELNKQTERHGGWYRLEKLNSGNAYNYKRDVSIKPNERNPYKNKPFQAMTEEWMTNKTKNNEPFKN